MNSYDVIAWHCDGAVYCPDCEPAGADPVFADNASEENGATCDACGACLVGLDWLPHDAAVGPTVRWSRCISCNAQQPYDVADSDYRRARKAALLGKLHCRCCSKPTEHF